MAPPGVFRPPRRAGVLGRGLLAAGGLFLAAAGSGQERPPAPAEFERAAAALREGDSAGAEAAVAEFLAGREADPAAHHRVGALWLLAGDPERAVPHLRAALEAAPDATDSRLALGQALGQLGDTEGALAAFAAAAGSAPERYEAPYLAAAVLDRAGRLPEAVTEARSAAALAPGNASVRRFLGRLLLRIEAWPEAAAELEAALRQGFREDPAIFSELGAALLGQERLDAARAAYERHREFAPEDAETLLQLGYLAWRRGAAAESESLLWEALALDPALRRAHHFLGLTALRRDDLAGAEAAFRRALEGDPDFAEAWFHLGKIELRRGNPEAAARHLERALASAPGYAEAYYQLAFARRRLGDAEGAAESLARFTELRRAEGRTRPPIRQENEP